MNVDIDAYRRKRSLRKPPRESSLVVLILCVVVALQMVLVGWRVFDYFEQKRLEAKVRHSVDEFKRAMDKIGE